MRNTKWDKWEIFCSISKKSHSLAAICIVGRSLESRSVRTATFGLVGGALKPTRKLIYFEVLKFLVISAPGYKISNSCNQVENFC